jgi:hypothetical protein
VPKTGIGFVHVYVIDVYDVIISQKTNVIPIAPNGPGMRQTARQQAQPYPAIRPKQIKLEALDPPSTPSPQLSRFVATPQPAIAVHRPVAVRTNSVDSISTEVRFVF